MTVEQPQASPSAADQVAPDTLLAAKLSIPPTRADVVPRAHLIEQLEQGASNKLTLVSAPAGYGKTTLLSHWAGNRSSSVAWIALSEADSGLVPFFTYLITALRAFEPEFGQRAEAMLAAPGTPSSQDLGTALLNDLEALAGELVIVLDDYHVIDSQPVHEAVNLILEHLPAPIHLVIAVRSDPPLALARLRAAGGLAELRAADLRFSSEEASSFIEGAMGVPLSPESVALLEKRVEGWAAGLQLAGLALKGHDDVEQFLDEFGGSHRFVIDYLTDEVMQNQPAELQAFLQDTSILHGLTAELCDAVTGRDDSGLVLANLEHSNLFVVPLDQRRRWYRYHPLFRDALHYRLLEGASDAAIQGLHRRAAGWYERNGFVDEALAHWLAAGEHENAADLVQEVGLQVLAQAELRKLRNWLDQLPGPLLSARPWLSLQYGWILNLAGQFDEMERRLQEAERALPNESEATAAEIRGNIATVRAGAARKQHNSEAAIQYLEQALTSLPPEAILVRSSAHFNLGTSYLDLGNVLRGEQELREAIQGAQSTGNSYTLFAGRSYLADCHVLQGQLQRATRVYQAVIREAQGRRPGQKMPLAGYAHSGLGSVLFEQNLRVEAESHLRQALELGEQLADWTILRRALPTLARIQHIDGRDQEARASWDRAMDLAQTYGDQAGVSYLEALRVRMWLEQAAWGSNRAALRRAGRWAEDYLDRSPPEADYREVYSQSTLAWLEILQGQPVQAISRLQRIAEAARGHGRLDCLIRTQTCLALAHEAGGEADAAREVLRQSVELAMPEGYRRLYLEFGPPMSELLQGILPDPSGLDYARTLVEAFAAERRESGAPSLAEALTRREIEVLRLLADGLSNAEIAEELVIALGTVKQYNHAIYRKLEVRSRHEAAERARALNLL